MGRHRSTIYREIKRNSFRDTEIPEDNSYHSVVADNIRNARRTRLRKLRRYPELRKVVIKQLEPQTGRSGLRGCVAGRKLPRKQALPS
ncbi:hypothetical protein CQ059_19575 [Brucella pseudogrignonensis]|uniref:Putative transposase n=1 Tax=Brucella pseudogrignonensis TaxID=419475 RepID=A0A256GB90_9HYPH|nr:hypothetical protein [Ochrobactrum sp. MYb237]NKX17300.1 hypothetical protein [Brucella pseudogrignonensis]OYR24206.1 putative transposase [Brucella pseudogrignonensis]PQZ38860.1 hypothetical protein CQ059_19575 [Brucella pseudogrignonensis]PRA40955.1 hypothetical protein CQ063_10485 [Brucella pseudogrignonensis]